MVSIIWRMCSGSRELTRIKTRLPLRSQSVMDSLFERDILPIDDLRIDFLWYSFVMQKV